MKNKKIVTIIELEYHADNISELIKIFNFKYKNADLVIRLVLKYSIFEIIQSFLQAFKNVELFVHNDNIAHLDCIKKSKEIFDTSDIVFINTVATQLYAYTTIFHPNIVLRVHNSNKQFAAWTSIDTSLTISNLNRLFRFVFKNLFIENYFKNIAKINNRVRFFCFSDLEMLNYANKIYPGITQKNSFYLPLKMFNKSEQQDKSNRFNILIIGRIDDETRDIELLRSTMTKLAQMTFNKPIHISFVGTGDTQEIRKLAKFYIGLSNENLTFSTVIFNVSQVELYNYLKNANVIICPLKLDCKVGVFKERYGQTKVSGNFSDIAISQIPVFLPKDYISHEKVVTHDTVYFSDADDLVFKIVQCLNNNEYYALLKQKVLQEAEKRYGQKIILDHIKILDNILT